MEGKFVKQSGGRGQYGHVWLKLEPQPGKGNEFVDGIKGGRVPKEFIPAVKKGVDEAINEGVLAGYPVVDIKVTLTDGSYHEVDSNENAFKMAAIFAFKDGMRAANPVLLEPIMAVEVETPEEKMGDVIGDLSSRRGVIQGMDDLPGSKAIKAEVPLNEMFGYSTHAALADPGARHVHDGIQALRRGAEERRRGVITPSHPRNDRKLTGRATSWQKANSSAPSRT